MLPIERPLFQREKVTDEKDEHENGHGAEDHAGVMREHGAVNDRPRVKKNDLDIEKNKKHGDEVKFDREARAAFADRQHAAFVGHVLDARILSFLAEQDGGEQSARGKTDGHDG